MQQAKQASQASIERAINMVIQAIKDNDAQLLYNILVSGFPVEHKIGIYTLLQFAVVHAGGFDIVRCLIHCKADLKAKMMDGRNIIHLCCRNNRVEMLKSLWQEYIDPYNLTDMLHERTLAGVTPFMMAIQAG